MKLRGIFFLSIIIGFNICFVSCKQQNLKPAYQQEQTDSIYAIKKTAQNFRLNIRNPSSADAIFYITPKEIDLHNDSTIIYSFSLNGLSEKEKCIRLWKFISEWTYHSMPVSFSDEYYHNPVFFLNGFESGFCDDRNAALAALAAAAGIKARVYYLRGHVVAELFYNNAWHLFDADKNIFYTDANGGIVDVEYLKIHPELIDEYTPRLQTFIQKLKNKRTKNAILSSPHLIDSLHDFQRRNYTSAITLRKDDEITFSVSPVNSWSKKLKVDFAGLGGPLYERKGKLASKFLQEGGRNISVYKVELPYPVTKISVRKSDGEKVKLYYSTDSLHWYFRGEIDNFSSTITFNAFNELNDKFTFNYFLKAVSEKNASEKIYFKVESDFTFSDKILLNNNERAFKIVPLNEPAHKLEVKFASE